MCVVRRGRHGQKESAHDAHLRVARNAVNSRAVLAGVKELVFQDFEPPVRLWFLHQHLVARRLEDVWSIIPEGVIGRHWEVPTQRVFSHWPVRGGTQWTPQRLTWVAAMMAWDEGQTLDSRWEHAREVAGGLHTHWALGTSYAGFAAALVRESPRIIAGIKTKFRQGDAGHGKPPPDALWLASLRGRWFACGSAADSGERGRLGMCRS